MGEVKLEPIEAGSVGPNGGLHMLITHLIHVLSGHLPRHLSVRSVPDRRRAHDLPIAFVERIGVALPHQFCGTFSPGMTDLHTNLRRRMGVDELRDPRPSVGLLVGPDASVCGRNPSFGRNAGHLGHDETGASHRTTPQMDKVPFPGHTVDRRILVHGRYHYPIGKNEVANLIWVEHRRYRRVRCDR